MATVTSLQNARRIVLKIGSALLVDPQKRALRLQWLEGLAKDVAALRQRGVDVLIVSSGSIALGRRVLDLPNSKLTLEESQASAAVGQIALAQAYKEVLGQHQITTAQVLLTSEDGENRRRYLNTRATLNSLLDMGVVPIINENDSVATDEIRFGDNDRLAAQLAVMAGADLLVLFSDVDGVYSANPKLDANAKHLPLITQITPEIIAMAGGADNENSKGGMITKLQAANTAINGGVSMAIALGAVDQPIQAMLDGARVSWFTAKTDPAHARKSWIATLKTRGEIIIDAGALKALHGGSSLLAAGCVEASGAFNRGDAVNVLDQAGLVIARGLIGYDFDEAQKILRAKSGEIEARLGYAGRGAMIHRDNLAMV